MNKSSIIHLTEVTSTNSYLKDKLQSENVPEWTIVTSDFQSKGRGQQGNYWEAESGKNLLMSMVLYPHFLKNHQQFLVAKLIAVALCETFSAYASGFSIKWPNDIYWKDKKIAGTLIENEWLGDHIHHMIVGNGINLNQTVFVSDAPNPISLIQICGHKIDRNIFLAQFIERAKAHYEALTNLHTSELNETYQQHLYRHDGYYPYADKEGLFNARILKVGDDGYLYLTDEQNRIRTYCFKEVQFMLN